MKRFFVFILSLVFPLLLIGCDNSSNNNVYTKPDFYGSYIYEKSESISTTIKCSEYETIDGTTILGIPETTTPTNYTFVNNERKNLEPIQRGLIEKSTMLYLGFVGITKTLKVNYKDTSEEIEYDNFNIETGYYENDTLLFLGQPTSSRETYAFRYYIFNGVEYRQDEITYVKDGYIDKETNRFTPTDRFWSKFTINNQTYLAEEVIFIPAIGSDYPDPNIDYLVNEDYEYYYEISTMKSYYKDDIETKCGVYNFSGQYIDQAQVKQVQRLIYGVNKVSEELLLGYNLCEHKTLTTIQYDYSSIEGLTYTIRDNQEEYIWYGVYGILNDTIVIYKGNSTTAMYDGNISNNIISIFGREYIKNK